MTSLYSHSVEVGELESAVEEKDVKCLVICAVHMYIGRSRWVAYMFSCTKFELASYRKKLEYWFEKKEV